MNGFVFRRMVSWRCNWGVRMNGFVFRRMFSWRFNWGVKMNGFVFMRMFSWRGSCVVRMKCFVFRRMSFIKGVIEGLEWAASCYFRLLFTGGGKSHLRMKPDQRPYSVHAFTLKEKALVIWSWDTAREQSRFGHRTSRAPFIDVFGRNLGTSSKCADYFGNFVLFLFKESVQRFRRKNAR